MVVGLLFIVLLTRSVSYQFESELECRLTGENCNLMSILDSSSYAIIDELRKQIHNYPEAPASYTALVQTYLNSAQWDKAGEILDRFEESQLVADHSGRDTALQWIERGRTMLSMVKGTVSMSAQHGYGNVFNDLVLFNRGMHALRTQKYNRAMMLLEHVARSMPDWPPGLHAYGVALYHSQKFELAAKMFQGSNRSCYAGAVVAKHLAKSSVRNFNLILARAEAKMFAREQSIPEWKPLDSEHTRENFLLGAVQAVTTKFQGRLQQQQVESNGILIELGVWRGDSLRIIAQAAAPLLVHGFDSFQGLPLPFDSFPRGAFSTDGQVPVRLPLNVDVHPGWFNLSLASFFYQLQNEHVNVLFVHVDCDCYTSAFEALDVIAPHLVIGSILLFDQYMGYPEWKQGEAKAWNEVAHKHQIKFTFENYFEHKVMLRIAHTSNKK